MKEKKHVDHVRVYNLLKVYTKYYARLSDSWCQIKHSLVASSQGNSCVKERLHSNRLI